MIRVASEINHSIKSAEESLKLLKKNRDRYLYEFIPAKFAEMGIDKVEVDGNKVSLKTFVSGTMPKDPMRLGPVTLSRMMSAYRLV
jgi:hypothetical protein